MKLLRSFLAGACLLVSIVQPTQAAPAARDADLQRVDAEQLERDPAWLALLHYRTHGGGVESQADQQRFFLADGGRHSPRAELRAALAALHDATSEQDFACRFPARYEWLSARLGRTGAETTTRRCAALAEWLAAFPGRRVSIDFASSYLENPSSTFGHTFLRIYRDASDELLSPTINYAARTDAREGDLAFVTKGLFGGFPGVADTLPFYRRLRTYTEIEGRDIHEYDLALTPAEVRRLLLHTWEIKDGVFDYYFIHENCAYRTLALLDVARPGTGLLDRFGAVTVPVDTVRALRAAGMLGAQRLWPSLPKRVRELETQVDGGDSALARQLALGLATPAQLQGLPLLRQAGTLQLAHEYAAVLIDRDEGDRVRRKEILGAITDARLALAQPEVLASRAAPSSPEDGHDGALLGAGLRQRGGRHALALEYAAFQHTLTDPLPGYEPHAEISVLNPELEVGAGRVRLRRIDWLVAQSTIPSSTLFSPRAWRVAFTTRATPFADRDHLATRLAYHTGRAWQLPGNTVLALLPGLGIEAGSGLPQDAALLGALRTTLTRQGPDWSAQLEVVAERYFAGASLRRQTARATAEWRLSRNLYLMIGAAATQAPRREQEVLFGLRWRQPSLASPWQK